MRDMTVQLSESCNNADNEHESVDEIKVMAEDGRVLYYISMTDEGELEVSTGAAAMQDGKIKDTMLQIRPKANNRILIARPNYK